MTEMNCNICQKWLHAYLDNELDTVTATLVAEHLVSCVGCKQRYEEMKILIADTKENVPYFNAPEFLIKNIFSKIGEPIVSKTSIWDKIRNALQSWLAPAFSTTVLAAALLLYVSMPTNNDVWVDEVVSEHTRSLMAEHLTDVASSDKHTVKPWFTGKLDFSPPVYDFAAQGFTLIGGRLDYLQHQTAAGLSYRHNKHIINAFIMPTTESDSTPQNLSKRGYNIISWQQNHMRYILISDLNMAELSTLSQLMQKGM